MKYRCANCNNTYDGELLKCPHCGATMTYDSSIEPEVIKNEVITKEKPIPKDGIEKGPVLAYNIVYLLSLILYLGSGLLLMFAPTFFLMVPSTTPFVDFFRMPHSLYLKMLFDISWMFRGRFTLASIMDVSLFASALVAIIVPISPIVGTIKAMVKHEVTPYQSPKLKKNPVMDPHNYTYTMVTSTIFVVPELLIHGVLGEPVFTGSYFYIGIYFALFTTLSVVLLFSKNILHAHFKVVAPEKA